MLRCTSSFVIADYEKYASFLKICAPCLWSILRSRINLLTAVAGRGRRHPRRIVTYDCGTSWLPPRSTSDIKAAKQASFIGLFAACLRSLLRCRPNQCIIRFYRSRNIDGNMNNKIIWPNILIRNCLLDKQWILHELPHKKCYRRWR